MTNKCCTNKSETVLILADFLRIISEENRLKIICFLQKNNEQCVCKIQEILGIPQNLVSHHLRVLKDFNLLTSRKEGLNVYYQINSIELNKHKELLNKVLGEG